MLKKIGLLIASPLLTLIAVESLCGLLIQKGFQWEPPNARPTEVGTRNFELPTTWVEAKKTAETVTDLPTLGIGCFFKRQESYPFFPSSEKCEIKVLKENREETAYTVKFDSNSRRVSKSYGPRDFHFLVLGCSIAFGQGVNDDQTISSYISKYSRKHEGYNLGIPGSSPSEHLLKIENNEEFEGIYQKEGTAIYLLQSYHIFRFIGAAEVVGVWGRSLRKVVEPEVGKFVTNGNYIGTLYGDYVAPFLVKSNIVKLFQISLPRVTSYDYDAFSRLLLQISENYKSRTQSTNRFIVVIYPSQGDPAFNEYIRSFEKYGIPYLDYSAHSLDGIDLSSSAVKYDSHPTAYSYDYLAQRITKDLSL